MNDNVLKLAVCVCTYKRPRMLSECLRSLNTQNSIPPNVIPTIIVIDNDAYMGAKEVFDSTSFNHAARYVIEPMRGLSCVRNRALDAARAIGADYIAFIDDDAYVDTDWIASLMDPLYADVPVLQGRTCFLRPLNGSVWITTEYADLPQEGDILHSARANNVRISRAVIDAGLRFDSAFNFMGFEDHDFFQNAHAMGFQIRYTQMAMAYEKLHLKRLTLGSVFRFNVARAVSNSIIANKHGMRIPFYAFPLNMMKGVFFMLVAPFARLDSSALFKWCITSATKHFGRAAGNIGALFGMSPRTYEKTVGY